VGVIAQGQAGAIGIQWFDDISNLGSTTTQVQVAGVGINNPFSSTTGTVQIVTGFTTGTTVSNTWEFGVDGTLTLPGAITVDTAYAQNIVGEFDGGGVDYSFFILKADYPTANVEIQVGDIISKTTDPATSVVVTAAVIDDGTSWRVPTGPNFIYSGAWNYNFARPRPEWEFGVDGTLTAPGHLLPNANLAYDLGSTSSQWRSIYVGTGTIYIGGIELGVNRSEQVTVNGNPIITVNPAGNITVQGDNVITPATVSDIAPSAEQEGNLWFNTVEARTYVAYNEQWVDASPTVLAPPDNNPTYESVTFNDATTQTTAWTGTVSYRNLTDVPEPFNMPAFVGGGGANTWLTAE
jgi:hypothetical protein